MRGRAREREREVGAELEVVDVEVDVEMSNEKNHSNIILSPPRVAVSHVHAAVEHHGVAVVERDQHARPADVLAGAQRAYPDARRIHIDEIDEGRKKKTEDDDERKN